MNQRGKDLGSAFDADVLSKNSPLDTAAIIYVVSFSLKGLIVRGTLRPLFISSLLQSHDKLVVKSLLSHQMRLPGMNNTNSATWLDSYP